MADLRDLREGEHVVVFRRRDAIFWFAWVFVQGVILGFALAHVVCVVERSGNGGPYKHRHHEACGQRRAKRLSAP